jgi:ISXO2-like transposase domain
LSCIGLAARPLLHRLPTLDELPGRRSFNALAAWVTTDGLACFKGLADAGCTHYPIATGSGRRAALHPEFHRVNTALANIKAAIVGTYKAVRKKHVSPHAR